MRKRPLISQEIENTNQRLAFLRGIPADGCLTLPAIAVTPLDPSQ